MATSTKPPALVTLTWSTWTIVVITLVIVLGFAAFVAWGPLL